MSEDYLWDRTGEPDPEIQRLEAMLAPYRDSGARLPRRPRQRTYMLVAATASILLALVVWPLQHNRAIPASPSDWRMSLSGGPSQSIALGQTIETGPQGTAKLESELIGEVQLEANSQLQVLVSSPKEQRLALHRGTLHALIWAPPRRFQVATPSANAIDLGCQYTLRVLPDGSSLLTVESGWVAFQSGPVESFLPVGAACRTRPRKGPGLPYFEDAPEQFREAVTRFEDTKSEESLDTLLTNSRRRDALTLWHLVLRTSGSQKQRVAGQLASLVPGVNADGLVRNDRAALDKAWNSLGLGETEWWRTWKQRW
jgi:hypothetical protein